MAPVVPFIPAIIQGGGALLGFLGRPKTPKPSDLENQAFQEAITTSQEQRTGQRDLRRIGIPALAQATDFFGNLASGDPSRLGAAAAPEQNAIAASFRGSEQNIRETGRGGTRDLALALNSRDSAAAQAGVVGPLRSNAAAQLANIGIPAATSGSGQPNFGQVGAALGDLRLRGSALQTAAGQTAGGSIGNFLFDLAQNTGSKKPGGGFTPGVGTIEASPPGRGTSFGFSGSGPPAVNFNQPVAA